MTGVDPLRGTAFEHNPIYTCHHPPLRRVTQGTGGGGGGSAGLAKKPSFKSHIEIGNNWERER